MQVIIGRVSARKGARQHLDVAGRAHCGAGNGITAAATRWVVDGTVQLATVCRRCIKALRKALAAQAEAGDLVAADAAYAVATPEQVAAREAELAAAINAHLAQVNIPEPTPAETLGLFGYQYQQRLLAELAA